MDDACNTDNMAQNETLLISEPKEEDTRCSIVIRSSNDLFDVMISYLSFVCKNVLAGRFEFIGIFEKNGKIDYRMFPFSYNKKVSFIYNHDTESIKDSVQFKDLSSSGLADTKFTVELLLTENETVVGLNNHADKFRTLEIFFESKQNSLSFLSNFYAFNIRKNKEKVQVYIYRNYWSLVSNLEKRNLKSIFLDESIKSDLIRDITRFKQSREKYKHFGVPYKRNYLFTGPPGTGKTSFIFALASNFHFKIYIMNFTNEINDIEFTNALKNMDDDFSILLLEDIDALFNKRDSQTKSFITFSGLINCLDGISRKEGLITIMTTNHVEKLDAALKRPGRVDKYIQFDYPDKAIIENMFYYYFPDLVNNNNNSAADQVDHRDKDTNSKQSKNKNGNVFEAFYEKISSIRVTPALLQNYFFEFVDLPTDQKHLIHSNENIKKLKGMDISEKENTGQDTKKSDSSKMYL